MKLGEKNIKERKKRERERERERERDSSEDPSHLPPSRVSVRKATERDRHGYRLAPSLFFSEYCYHEFSQLRVPHLTACVHSTVVKGSAELGRQAVPLCVYTIYAGICVYMAQPAARA